MNLTTIKKPLVLAAAVCAVGLVGGVGVVSAHAAPTADGTTLVERVAERFGLNQEDVQGVFDEHRDQLELQRSAEQSERLQEAVDDGDITAEQMELIESKRQELEGTRETAREELEDWAEENDIELRYLMHIGGRGHHGGPKGRF